MDSKLPALEVSLFPSAEKAIPGLQQFQWTEISNKCKLGEGSFAGVYSARFKGKTVVVKKLKSQKNERNRLLFVKEVRILSQLKSNYIVKVEGFCSNPVAAMLEYNLLRF